MAHIAYKRVSTVDQQTDRQLADCSIQFDYTFEDKCTGSKKDRPALAEMQRHVRRGDTIHVHSIDRLARSTANLLELVNAWNEQGISVVFYKQNMTFTGNGDDATSKLMLTILASVAEFELALIKERQREGIEKAKAKGDVYKGGFHKRTKDDKRNEILQLLADGMSIRKTAEQAGVGVSTVQRIKIKSGVVIQT